VFIELINRIVFFCLEEGVPVKVSQQRKNDSASTSKLQHYSDEDSASTSKLQRYDDEGSTSSNVHDNASNEDSGSFLQGISIHLYNFAPDEQRSLTRQIVSADGDVHATVEQGTNYIVVSGNNFNHEASAIVLFVLCLVQKYL
jgi:bisphosphoglycerate-independent phosphoglycerate mutase (AlkP superfamily)